MLKTNLSDNPKKETNGVHKISLNPTHIRVLPDPVENGTNLDGVSKKVFLDRYSLKDEFGNYMEEYPEQMWRRISKAIARVEETPEKQKEWEEKFYSAMTDFKFIPGGRILSGAGTGYDVTYYNCYVLPSPKDSRHGIMENLTQMIDIMSRGGGVGINLSSLRPRGARVKKVNGFSSGPMNWAELYSVATHDVIQQGGTRRGALMLMLWDWHPDIEEFITTKQDLSRIVGANLSVCVSDRLMQAIKNNEEWPLLFPDLDDPEYDNLWDGVLDNWIKMGKKVKIHKTIRARELWDLICDAAWASAEPGLVFMERYNKENSNWYFNTINCVNPCGEEGLPEYGVCNLGSINLATFVKDGKMDYESLTAHVKVAVRFNDNVIDGDIYIFEGIKETQLNGERRIGVGTMGLGDALIKMKIRYGSEESIPVIEKIYKVIRDAAFDASSDYAAEKGAFPKFDKEKYLQGPFIKRLPEEIKKKIVKQGVRNSVILMQAPTGSTSLMAGVTSGIEPVYEFSFTRRDRLGEHKIYHSLYKEWMDSHPGEDKPDYFVSANDLTPGDHVKVQAAVQKYVDASISKTVNAPNAHTVEDVKKLYMMAYELGCKGVTYMRDGSRPGVLTRDEAPKPKTETVKEGEPKQIPLVVSPNPDENISHMLNERPERVEGVTYRVMTPMGSAFITINHDEAGNPLEVFINIGRAGSDVAAMAEALGRTISAMLRIHGQTNPVQRVMEIIDQLSGIGGSRSIGFGPNKVRSLPDAIALALSRHFSYQAKIVDKTNNIDEVEKLNGNGNSSHIKEQVNLPEMQDSLNLQAGAVMAAHNPDPTPASADQKKSNADICPQCGVASLVHEEGCSKCYSCGHAEC